MSDESPDVPRAWSRYAQAGTAHNARDAARVERTNRILTDVLATVNRRVARRARSNPISAQLYGINVHTEFADEVRALDLPGIGYDGVEQSFNWRRLVYYGFDDSVRTDVVLRNREGRIIAIFDVKTGNAIMRPSTESRYRKHTGIGQDVPIIILHAVRGTR